MVDSTHNGGPPIEDDRAGNWFAVSREIFSHPIVGVGDRAYTDLEAWLSLLAMASYEPRRAMNKGTVIVLDPGDLMAAHSFLAQRWKWTADKVRWFLKRLQTEAMITRHCASHPTKRNTNQIQILTICNYAKYQLIKQAEHQAKQQAERQASTNPTPSQHQEYNKVTIKHREGEAREVAAAIEDEVQHEHGVVVNCKTIRHPAFTISLPSIEMGVLAAGLTKEDVKTRCLAHALQWAAQIEAGDRRERVVPDKIANFLSASIMGEVNRRGIAGVRMGNAAAARPAPKKTLRQVLDEQKANGVLT